MNTSTRLTSPTESRIRPLSSEVTHARERTEHTARRLSLLAMRNWEKGITGVVALPAAAALTAGAGVLFAVSVVEHVFGMIEGAVAEVGHRVGIDFDAHGDLHESGKENGSQPS